MRRPIRRVVATGALLFGLSGMTASVNADHIEIEAIFPESVATGDVIDVRVIVRTASGQRIADATVIALEEATFTGVTDQVEIARGITNELGVATLRWQVRTASSLAITLQWATPGDPEFETEQVPPVDVTAGAQLERSTSGVKIPGFGAWVLIALLVGVWGLIQFALAGPVRVAAGSTDSTHHHAEDDDELSRPGPNAESEVTV
jgi:hypothetical protein